MKSLAVTLTTLLVLSGVASVSLAAAHSTDPLRCTSMEKLAQDHKTWSVGFEKYLQEFGVLGKNQKFHKATRGTERILHNIENLSHLAGVDPDENLLEESRLDLDNASLGDLPKTHASTTLKDKMLRLQTEMSNIIFRAQAKMPDCNLGTVNSPQI